MKNTNCFLKSEWYVFNTFNLSFLKKYLFLKGGREGEGEGEKHQSVVASHVPPTGDLAHNQACALTGNRSSNHLVHRPVLNPLSYTSQGQIPIFVRHIMAFTLLNNVPSFENVCIHTYMCIYLYITMCMCVCVYIYSNKPLFFMSG